MQQVLERIMGFSDKLWITLQDLWEVLKPVWLQWMIILFVAVFVLFYTTRFFFNRWRTH
jgi:hypothetical protein